MVLLSRSDTFLGYSDSMPAPNCSRSFFSSDMWRETLLYLEPPNLAIGDNRRRNNVWGRGERGPLKTSSSSAG